MRFLAALALLAQTWCAFGQSSPDAVDAARIKVAQGFSVTVFAKGLAEPQGLLFTPAGDLYVAEQGGGEVSKISRTGTVSRIARGFNGPHDLALGADGIIYLAEMHANRIAAITAAGKVSTHIAGVPSPADLDFSPDGELLVGKLSKVASDGRVTVLLENLREPWDPVYDAAGNLYFAETMAGRILKIVGTF